jgi:hypothetical protein
MSDFDHEELFKIIGVLMLKLGTEDIILTVQDLIDLGTKHRHTSLSLRGTGGSMRIRFVENSALAEGETAVKLH